MSFVRFYLVAVLVAIAVGNLDYEVTKHSGRSWFTIPAGGMMDGGSTYGIGLGYTLINRNEIQRTEGDRVIFLVGPELRGWNIFRIFGARCLLSRHYGNEVYYRESDTTEKVVVTTIIGDRLGRKLLEAVSDLLPFVSLLIAFALWRIGRAKFQQTTGDNT